MIRNVESFGEQDLNAALAAKILQLKNTAWPTDQDIDSQVDAYLARSTARPQREILLLRDGDVPVAHAETFSRQIIAEQRLHWVGCLSGVCVLPSQRGEGLGRAVVEAAFAGVDADKFPLLLFQTEVADFYRNLGARVVDNRFINSRGDDPQANPWQGDAVMIYPGDGTWYNGVIDLNGGAF